MRASGPARPSTSRASTRRRTPTPSRRGNSADHTAARPLQPERSLTAAVDRHRGRVRRVCAGSGPRFASLERCRPWTTPRGPRPGGPAWSRPPPVARSGCPRCGPVPAPRSSPSIAGVVAVSVLWLPAAGQAGNAGSAVRAGVLDLPGRPARRGHRRRAGRELPAARPARHRRAARLAGRRRARRRGRRTRPRRRRPAVAGARACRPPPSPRRAACWPPLAAARHEQRARSPVRCSPGSCCSVSSPARPSSARRRRSPTRWARSCPQRVRRAGRVAVAVLAV